jgi:hypothetical protein
MSILQEHLKTYGGPHGSHHVYWIPVDVFNRLPIDSWKHNRPPDLVRVEEIRTFMKESKRADGLIYLACVNNKIVCYESNHRREALKEGMPSDMAHILVDVLWNATDEQVKQEFFRLNKAVSVPELYVTDEAVPLEVVRHAVDAFCNNYKSLRSPAAHPQRPNFNRDRVMDEFYRMMKELHIGVDELMERLTRLNRAMSQRDKRRLTEKTVKKCEASGLWLFAWSDKLNAKELE